jgi:hypothetical protein
MFTTDLAGQLEHKDRSISEWEAWEQASESQRRIWFPLGWPSGKGTVPAARYGDAPDAASLERAIAAGQRAVAAGYGSVRADGLAPCGHCSPCSFGRPNRCHHPQSKAMARLRAQQAAADRLDQAEADLLELQRTLYREQTRRGSRSSRRPPSARCTRPAVRLRHQPPPRTGQAAAPDAFVPGPPRRRYWPFTRCRAIRSRH